MESLGDKWDLQRVPLPIRNLEIPKGIHWKTQDLCLGIHYIQRRQIKANNKCRPFDPIIVIF